MVGHSYVDLRAASLRQFGGTTNHWTAWTEPLDPIDLEARTWVPDSGWPFDRALLERFYDRAARLLQLGEQPFDLAAWEREVGAPVWRVEGDGLRSQLVRIVTAERRALGRLLHDTIDRAGNVTAYLHATVLELVPDGDVRGVTRLRVRTRKGNEITARAQRFVLATGGLENPRRLLLSSSVQRAGLGNRHDLVGRFFANHPALPCGFHPRHPGIVTTAYAPPPAKARLGHATLTLSAARQRDEQLLNLQCHLFLGATPGAGSDTATQPPAARVAADVERFIAGAPRSATPLPTLPLNIIAETSPTATSRVRLGDERDAFGQPRIVLEWRTRDTDRDTILRGVRSIAGELGAADIARLSITSAGLQFGGSFHHMGTTRMHTDPTRGVVDADCRVHGLDNLYIAGSSVFPTYGTVNPTFTIIALALRLADHLKAVAS